MFSTLNFYTGVTSMLLVLSSKQSVCFIPRVCQEATLNNYYNFESLDNIPTYCLI